MTKFKHAIATAVSVAALAGSLGLIPVTASAAEKGASVMEQGKAAAFNRKLGNCLACHQIAGGNFPGNIGPPLVAMKHRYKDKASLKEQIADPTKRNPHSIMPPFGKHNVVSESQLDAIVEYIYSL